MEKFKPNPKIEAEAFKVAENAQLAEHPVVLEPFVVSDLLTLVAVEHERRVAGQIYEPLSSNRMDIAHALLVKFSLGMSAARAEGQAEMLLNKPEINLIRELMMSESELPYIEKMQRDSDILSFEHALVIPYDQVKKHVKEGSQEAEERRKIVADAEAVFCIEQELDGAVNNKKYGFVPRSSQDFYKSLFALQEVQKTLKKKKKIAVDSNSKQQFVSIAISKDNVQALQEFLDEYGNGRELTQEQEEEYRHMKGAIDQMAIDFPTAMPIVEKHRIKGLLGRMKNKSGK